MAAPSAARPLKTTTPSSKLILSIGPVALRLSGRMAIEPQLLGAAGIGRGKDPTAEIAANPNDPAMLGLRNVSHRPYRAKLTSGKTIE
jgi:hypothetical protein